MNHSASISTGHNVTKTAPSGRARAHWLAKCPTWNSGPAQKDGADYGSTESIYVVRTGKRANEARWDAMVTSQEGMRMPKRNPLAERGQRVTLGSWLKGLVTGA